MFSKILFIFTLFVLTFTLKNRQNYHLSVQKHFLNGELCKKLGGYVCGFIDKDCCAKGCQSKYFGLNEVCVDGKQLQMNTMDCQKVCQQKGGVTFNNKIISDIQCCKKDSLKDGNCIQGGKINLGVCNQETLADKIVGLVTK